MRDSQTGTETLGINPIVIAFDNDPEKTPIILNEMGDDSKSEIDSVPNKKNASYFKWENLQGTKKMIFEKNKFSSNNVDVTENVSPFYPIRSPAFQPDEILIEEDDSHPKTKQTSG